MMSGTADLPLSTSSNEDISWSGIAMVPSKPMPLSTPNIVGHDGRGQGNIPQEVGHQCGSQLFKTKAVM